ncbi:MAG: ABC transporter permease [Prolixibacteraceae bacterium]|nr:ABC transporter permease [Prolixibacteraceae bacterium]
MFRIFKKDIILFLKDRRSVILTFLLPIILISLFTFAFGGMSGGNGDSNPIDLLITDFDKTKASENITYRLDTLKSVAVQIASYEESKEKIIKGDFPAALVLHKGFEDSMMTGKSLPVELLYDKAREMETGLLQPILINTLMSTLGKEGINRNVKEFIQNKYPEMDESIKNQIFSDINSDEGTMGGFKMDSNIKMTSLVGEQKEINLGLIQAVTGVAIMMLLFSVAAMGASILEEKESGTLSRLLYSPLKTNDILFGKMFSSFIIGIFQLIVMFIFAWLAFGLDIFINIPAILILIVCIAYAISGFGIFLASISKTRQQAQGLSTLVILIMSAIGGSMIPIFIMPSIMKKIAVISVNYWGIQGFYDIFWRKLPLINILPKAAVLIFIGTLLIIISIRLFRKNILKLV